MENKVLSFLSKSHLLLNTSYYEGFYNTFLESLSVKTPIVTTQAVDPNNFIQKNNLGFICMEHSDFANYSKKIYKFLFE